MSASNDSEVATIDTVEKMRRDWIRNPSGPFRVIMPSQKQGHVFWSALSKNIELVDDSDNEKISIFSQYYIDSDARRAKEISRTLMLQACNDCIDNIYLLNERIYTPEEMGFNTPEEIDLYAQKIVQIDCGQRMTYKSVFDYVSDNEVKGHIIICNSDIFFDKTIDNIRYMNLTESRRALCLLRYEYDGEKSLKDCKLFGPRADSQDTWIFHSSNIPDSNFKKAFDFALGIPGCDNKMTYLFQVCGIECFNVPNHIRTYHYHRSQKRNYNSQTKPVPTPWVSLIPIVPNESNEYVEHSYNIQYENDNLFNYVSGKLEKGETFIIPRIAGVENDLAYYGVAIGQGIISERDFIEQNAAKVFEVMKNNAGIKLENINDIRSYSNLYLEAFHKCDAYFDWEPWGNVYPFIRDSHDFITTNFEKKRIWSLTLDVFNNIQRRPWTWSLKGKRLLIVSSFVDSIKSKLDTLSKVYGVDLFPDCTFVFLKPPQTQGRNPSLDFKQELGLLGSRIAEIKDTFDVALLSCGGYGNPLIGMLHSMDISAIYIGGVLQMYFGIYGARWLRERPDIMRLYLNKHWTRPTVTERPNGHEQVEKSCYW